MRRYVITSCWWQTLLRLRSVGIFAHAGIPVEGRLLECPNGRARKVDRRPLHVVSRRSGRPPAAQRAGSVLTPAAIFEVRSERGQAPPSARSVRRRSRADWPVRSRKRDERLRVARSEWREPEPPRLQRSAFTSSASRVRRSTPVSRTAGCGAVGGDFRVSHTRRIRPGSAGRNDHQISDVDGLLDHLSRSGWRVDDRQLPSGIDGQRTGGGRNRKEAGCRPGRRSPTPGPTLGVGVDENSTSIPRRWAAVANRPRAGGLGHPTHGVHRDKIGIIETLRRSAMTHMHQQHAVTSRRNYVSAIFGAAFPMFALGAVPSSPGVVKVVVLVVKAHAAARSTAGRALTASTPKSSQYEEGLPRRSRNMSVIGRHTVETMNANTPPAPRPTQPGSAEHWAAWLERYGDDYATTPSAAPPAATSKPTSPPCNPSLASTIPWPARTAIPARKARSSRFRHTKSHARMHPWLPLTMSFLRSLNP